MNIRKLNPYLFLPALALLLTACGEEVSAGEAVAGGIGIWAIGSILLLILVVLAVIDLIKKPYPMEKKLIWGAIILFLPYLGAILYFLIGRNRSSVF
ncbi:PLD nuclease N-terminal domain-containing protein [Neolewinella litorea]|uniref:PLDc_N domain-containing protein n=1 Tax=Neolewinella litorea TaxID=2562452 RepID=A0A4S4NJE5_9BACT|nr:PLD nuclease N-terminal domain-containing protein [Neolewinella litorea]THH39924.1 PLDc_N domain-containing protein [Neolewinella litorea]